MTRPDAGDEESMNQHLSKITTVWTAVFNAHRGEAAAAYAAQRQLVERYRRAVYRYLMGAVRNPDVADELFQEFALRLVAGSFKRADPGRGRFRDFLKTALFHLIVDHQRRQRGQPLSLTEPGAEPADEEQPGAEQEAEFLNQWRNEVLSRSWEALEEIDRRSGQQLYVVLRFRSDHPEMRSPEMAAQLGPRLGRAVSPEWVRKWLRLARDKFTDLLLAEVEHSLHNPTFEDLEQEVIDLGLIDYCKSGLERRRP
jgi:RNA polymerase sigma-70 factor (ECF subfamily)